MPLAFKKCSIATAKNFHDNNVQVSDKCKLKYLTPRYKQGSEGNAKSWVET